MKTFSLCTAIFLSTIISGCHKATPLIDTWEVEVKLLETTPFPELEEVQPYEDALIAHRYQLLSAVTVNQNQPTLTDPQLIILHWAIRDKEPVESVKGLRQNDIKKFTLQRRSDRGDLNGRYIKNGIDNFELLLFVEAEGY